MQAKVCIIKAEVIADVTGMWIGLFLAQLGGLAFSKYSSRQLDGRSTDGYAFFMLINGLTACAFFFVSGGFRVTFTVNTLLFAVVYALIVLMSLITTLKAYQTVEISNVNVVQNASNLVASSALGCLLFDETIDGVKILRILLMLAAVVLIFFGTGAKRPSGDRHSARPLRFAVIALLLTVAASGSVLVPKFYARASGVADDNSFFFLTNAVLVIGAMLWLTVLRLRDGVKASLPDSFFNWRLVFFMGNTVCANVASLIGIRLIARMDVSLYTPISAAIGILCGGVASVLFREKWNVFAVLAVVLAAVAVMV